MRHTSTAILTVLALTLLTTCDKVPMNGPLDGMWQLMSVETPDGLRPTRDDELFLSFQLHLTQWEKKHTSRTYFAHFERRGDSLRIYDITRAALHDLSHGDDDHLITDAQMSAGEMDAWGIHTTTPSFHINRLDCSNLTLQAADTTLTFRKY